MSSYEFIITLLVVQHQQLFRSLVFFGERGSPDAATHPSSNENGNNEGERKEIRTTDRYSPPRWGASSRIDRQDEANNRKQMEVSVPKWVVSVAGKSATAARAPGPERKLTDRKAR